MSQAYAKISSPVRRPAFVDGLADAPSSGTTFPKSRRNASATPRALSVPAFSRAALLACGERKWVFWRLGSSLP